MLFPNLKNKIKKLGGLNYLTNHQKQQKFSFVTAPKFIVTTLKSEDLFCKCCFDTSKSVGLGKARRLDQQKQQKTANLLEVAPNCSIRSCITLHQIKLNFVQHCFRLDNYQLVLFLSQISYCLIIKRIWLENYLNTMGTVKVNIKDLQHKASTQQNTYSFQFGMVVFFQF